MKPSTVFPSNLPRMSVRGLRKTGRDDQVIVYKRLLSPRPLFIWKFFIFHIISQFANLSWRAIREGRASF